MDTLVGMIETHPTEKTLIFCVFRDEMAEIQRRLVHKRTYVISGSVPQDQRIRDLNSFRAHKGGAIYIIQIQAGGVGLNLQEATRVYITAPHWNPAMELQAIARAHRKGQTRQVIVRKLVYMSEPELPSIEQSIMTLQNHKSIVCAQVLNDPRLEEQLPKIQSKVVAPELRKLFI
jgi:SNF2 family DNA or RNA helicase